MKKIALLLCLILVATILFGCGSKTAPPNPGKTDGPTTDAGTTENPYDENGYIRDSIPAGLNYGNETVRVMGWSNSEASYDFNTDYAKGDEIAATVVPDRSAFSTLVTYSVLSAFPPL